MTEWKYFFKDKKNQLILLLMSLCTIRALQTDVKFVLWIAGGVLACVLLEVLMGKFLKKKRTSVKSAVISGFIISGILDYNLDWQILFIFCAVAILSKFFIRIKNKHVFNPANFGLFTMALFKQPLTWNIESNIYLIIAVGIYIAVTLRKWPHVLGFLLVFSGTFYFSGVNPLNMISWFFVFVMLIEPKTSGFGTWKGLMFGSIAGLTSFIMFKFIPQIDIFVTSLIVANIFNASLAIKGRKNV